MFRFTVNFLRGNDIAFHLNSRFNEGGKQAVVRNHKVGEHWGKEERYTHGGFPFMAGRSFEVSGNILNSSATLTYNVLTNISNLYCTD